MNPKHTKDELKSLITQGFSSFNTLSSAQKAELKTAVEETLSLLEEGTLRVAEKVDGLWQVNAWMKEAILLSFRLSDNRLSSGPFAFDKVPQRFEGSTEEDMRALGIRVLPGAVVRRGAHVGRNVILMPSFVNIGAFVDEGTMVDTWATVGSCAQIGKGVHLSGGVGIGGVLEPPGARPTIIEDHCFIGARSEVVEGVVVEEGSVIGMGVFLGQSTKIYHRQSGEIFQGRVPKGSVVVSGSLPARDGSHSLYAAIIVKQVDDKTRSKVSLNELLRDLP